MNSTTQLVPPKNSEGIRKPAPSRWSAGVGLWIIPIATALILFGSNPKAEAASSFAPAATITVDRVDDNAAASACTAAANDCSLRGAISFANANPGTVITLPAGTYTLSIANAGGVNEDANATGDLDVNTSMTITGAGAASTIIQAGTTTSNGIDKVFAINPICTSAVSFTMSGVTVQNGRNTQPFGAGDFSFTGGGLDWCGFGTSALSLSSDIFTNNTNVDGYGGGINIDTASGATGAVTISDTTISNNTTKYWGGGINIFGASPQVTLTHVTISNNTTLGTGGAGAQGGGVNVRITNFPDLGGFVTINSNVNGNSTISGNASVGAGAGICICGGDVQNVIIQNASITGNTSHNNVNFASFGGGVYVENDATHSTTLTNVTISGNHANDFGTLGAVPGGGGIRVSSGLVTVNGTSVITGNDTAGNGGGIDIENVTSTVNMTAGSITNNTAKNNGGGIFLTNSGAGSFTKITITGNQANSDNTGGGDGGAFYRDTGSGSLTLNYNRITGNTSQTGGGGTGTTGLRNIATGTVDATNNWWGCNGDPSVPATGCDSVTGTGTTTVNPRLQLHHTASPGTILFGGNSTLTADFLTNSANSPITLANLSTLIGLPITFNNAINGSLSGAQTTIQSSASATATFTATGCNTGTADAKVDNATATAAVTIQCPDMQVSKSNNVGGTLLLGNPFTWTLTVSNTGTMTGTFTSGQIIISDTLPTTNITYGAPVIANTINITNSGNINCSIVSNDLSCTASGASVLFGFPNGRFDVSFPVTPTVTGTYANPRAAGNCSVDPNNNIVEANEGNNTCSNSVTVVAPDLIVSKSNSVGGTVQLGNTFTWTLTISNTGNGPAVFIPTSTILTDTLDNSGGLTYGTPAVLNPTNITNSGNINCTINGSSTLSCIASGSTITIGANTGKFDVAVPVTPTIAGTYINPRSGGTCMVNPNNAVTESSTGNNLCNTNTVTVTVSDLTIAKSHSGNFTQGQIGATYTITATNVGNGTTTSTVYVTDTLPSGLTATGFAGAGWTCTLSPLACSRSDALAVGASYPPLTLTVNVANNAAASVTNSVDVAGGGESNIANDNATDSTTIIQLADLTVTKSHVGNFSQGQVGAMYTITVTNAGAGATSGTVFVTDTLPLSLTATSLSGTGWTCNLGTLSCSRNDVLASSASYPALTLTVNVAGNAPASVTNSVQVAGGGELITANDTASDPTTINQGPDLTITKSHAGNFRQGQVGATYTITVTNIGALPTSGLVTVTDTLPSGLSATNLSGSGWACVVGTLTCTRNDVLSGGANYPALTLTVDVANNAAPSVTNTATVSGGSELNTGNDTTNDVTTIDQAADMMVTKSHVGNFTQGQIGATYTITVTNGGTGPTVGTVFVTDTLPSSLTATNLAGTGWTCNLGTLSCSRSDVLAASNGYPALTLTVNVAANAPTSVTNNVQVAGGGEVITNNDTASDPTTINQLADLTIAKSHIGNFFQGQIGATYTITVTNNGTGSSSGTVYVTETLPSGLTATGLTGTGWTCVLGTLSCSRSDVLAASASYPSITLTVDVANNAPSSATNNVQVAVGNDVNPGNNSASDLTTITQMPDLTIAKSHVGNFRQGDVGDTYTITVTNSGFASASGTVYITDTLPSGLTATNLTGTGWTCSLGTLSCSRNDALAASASYPSITLTVNVAANAPANVTNNVQVAGGGEVITSNDTASDPTTVIQVADMTVTKSHVGNFTQGDIGDTYTITVTNGGTGPTVGTVFVTDTLPSGLTATSLTGTGWTCILGTLSCSRSDVLAGSNNYPALTLTVNVAANAPASVTNNVQVAGGGEVVIGNDTTSDPTTINQLADLTISKSHIGNFFQGQIGATYTITVTNSGTGSTSGSVFVTDTLPSGLTATGLNGTGWTCNLGTLSCSRSDVLAASANYPSITMTVNVAASAAASVENNVQVAGGAEVITGNDTASDLTTITQMPDLTITKSHAGNFRQGDVGDTYTITVTNSGFASTSGTVLVTDTLPSGLTATGISGTGWTCSLGTQSCSRSDALAASASYPAITLTVNVAANAPASVTNNVQVAGGGEVITSNDTASDPTTITQVADMTVTKSHVGNFTQGGIGDTYTITVTNGGTGPTVGTVYMTDTLPSSLTATSLTGTGWTCNLGTLSCTRSDVVASGASYPAITLTVNVDGNAPSSVTNNVLVAGGGELNTGNNAASDPTTIIQVFGFCAALNGSQQVPTNASTGTGNGLVLLSPDQTQITTWLTWSGLGSNVTAAHIHGPAVAGVNAPVLFPFSGVPAVTSGSISPQVFAITPVQVGYLRTGLLYFNIHTTNFPGGEIRGQIGQCAGAELAIIKTHSGVFTQGQIGATYTITVTNSGNAPSSSTVTVTDTLPSGLTGTNMTGTGWSCNTSTLTCTRSDALAVNASYPPITLTVDVANNAPTPVTNTAQVSGGGDTNSLDNVASDVAIIYQKPIVTLQPSNLTICAGNLASFSSTASGLPLPTTQWQVSTNGGGSFSNVPGATSSPYSFTALASQNLNQFRALFTNVAGVATSNAVTLTVNTTPAITTQPFDATVTPGTSVTFNAAASASPSASIQWQVSTDNGLIFTNIAGANSSSYSFIATPALHGNLYRAVFTNLCGGATTNAARLRIVNTLNKIFLPLITR